MKSQIDERSSSIKAFKETLANERSLWQEKLKNKEREKTDISVRLRQKEDQLLSDLREKQNGLSNVLEELENEKREKEHKLKEERAENRRLKRLMEEQVDLIKIELQ